VSINTLAVIAVDRCFVIVRLLPLHNRMSRKTFITVITFLWLYSILWACAPFYGFGRYILEGTNTSCTFDFLTRTLNVRIYVIGIFFAHFIVPVIVIIVSYILIFRKIVQYKNELIEATKVHDEQEVPLKTRKIISGFSHETKTARVSIIVITVFCVSWTPYAIVALIGEFGDASSVTRLVSGIPCVFAKFSTIVNPLVYALLHPNFRLKLAKFASCLRSDGAQSVVHFRSAKPTTGL